MKKIKIVLIIIWMIVIFLLSNQPGDESSKLSNSLIDKTIVRVYEVFNGRLNNLEKRLIIEEYSYKVRKVAHFTEYFILGVLVYIYLIESYGSIKSLLLTVLICFVYAVTDEFHQLFINDRAFSPVDILIDTSGSLVSSTILLVKRGHK